jgi:hypothetical protein
VKLLFGASGYIEVWGRDNEKVELVGSFELEGSFGGKRNKGRGR